ncbi:cell division protein ZapE [Rhodococcus chondri]|uniref:Cell division protein ZapE n=1 Tax=Rhodococcus chondri TaxID=3065941 RepID=A0ABU7JRF3_9NOCA|nr:cell division protein ZapE [Rhodococcus sp. CC-R104]MEE2032615.1 cell division protein ZapE [Rhodococcus sp. CC-R104]
MILEPQREGADALARLARILPARRTHPGGVYLWGPVGRGKTWLMDQFLDSVTTRHRRVHFHRFFADLHADAHRLGAIDRAIDAAIGEARLLCFDEFHVHDPGDAMLAARTVSTLFARGVALVATSNYPTTQLLPNPLFHHLFEPTIALLEQHLDVVEVAGPTDLRRSGASAAESGFPTGRYLPVDSVSAPEPNERRVLHLAARPLRALAVRGGTVWFDFTDLCAASTVSADYLAVAREHKEWGLFGVPPLREADADAVRRFVNLIDVLCDADVRLTVVAYAPVDDLAAGVDGEPDLDRVISRLSLLEVADEWKSRALG